MDWVEAPLILLLYGSALAAAWLAVVLAQRRAGAWGYTMAALLVALMPWAMGQGLSLQAATLEQKALWKLAALPGVVTVPVAWMVLALQLTGREHLLRRSTILWMGLPALLTMPLALAYQFGADGNILYRGVALVEEGPFRVAVLSYGPWAWLHISYNVLLLVGGSVMMYPALLERVAFDGPWRRAAVLLAPWLAWPLFFLTRAGAVAVDVAPIGFMVSAALLVWILLNNPLADLVPVARQSVLAQMSDGVLVVNVQERIAYANPAAEALLQRQASALQGMRLEEALPAWRDVWLRSRQDTHVETELTIEQGGEPRQLELRVSPLTNESGEPRGRLLLWHDVTARQTAETLLARQVIFEKLLLVARATAMGLSLEETLQNALDVACSVTGAEKGSIFLLDDERRVTSSILARGSTDRAPYVGQIMEDGLAGWAVRQRQIVLVPDTDQDPRWLQLADQPYESRSVLVAPIINGEQVPGVLTLQHSAPKHFGDGEVELMQAATHQMALALHNAQVYERQRRLAMQQETVYDVLATINAELDQPASLEMAVERIRERTGWPAVAVLVPQGPELVVRAATGLLDEMCGATMPQDVGHTGAAFSTGETRLVRDLLLEPTYLPMDGVRSLVVAPLRRQEQLGVFLAGSDAPDAFGPEDLGMVELLAEALSLGMTSTRLFQAVSEEQTRLQSLIQASSDGIMLLGGERRLLVINPRALDYIGLPGVPAGWVNTPLDALQQALWERDPAVAAIFTSETRRVEKGDRSAGEGSAVTNGRDLHWMNLPVSLGETAGRLIVLQDVTRERELQRMRTDLTHMMVHDLRNPLNVVSSGLEIARAGLRDADQPKVKEILQIAGQSTERMLALVDDILHISRLEDGRLPLDWQTTSLGALLQDAIEAQRPLAEAKDLRLVARVQEELPPAYGDPWLLARVVHNLVDNAIKFAPPGGLVIADVCLEGKEFIVRVRDNGPGISPHMRERLFEKFVSSDGPLRGTGLGLAFCRLAVEAHGGQIYEASRDGQGAIFEFTLPLAMEAQPVT